MFYSALERPVDRQSALDAGADVYLVKSDDIYILGKTIRQLLRKRSAFESFTAAHHRRTARSII